MTKQTTSKITMRVEPDEALADFTHWPCVTLRAPLHVRDELLDETLDELRAMLRLREAFYLAVDLHQMENASLSFVKDLVSFAREHEEDLRRYVKAVAFVQASPQVRSLGRICAALYEPHFSFATCASLEDAAEFLGSERRAGSIGAAACLASAASDSGTHDSRPSL